VPTPANIEPTGRIARHGSSSPHAIGDRANREVLDLYERIFRAHPDLTDLRWRIEHAQHLDPDDVPRFAALGVIASMQGVHASSDGPWLPQRSGVPRSPTYGGACSMRAPSSATEPTRRSKTSTPSRASMLRSRARWPTATRSIPSSR
jgi:hypothetical protein